MTSTPRRRPRWPPRAGPPPCPATPPPRAGWPRRAATYTHRGIAVRAICPQGVRTPMMAGASAAERLILTDSAITPEEVADAVMAGIAGGRFLILPHPEVAGMYAGRAGDPDRWLR